MSVRSIGTSLTPIIPPDYKLLTWGEITGASQTGLGIGNIPQIYRNLKVVFKNLKGSNAGNMSQPILYFNGDFAYFISQALTAANNQWTSGNTYTYVSNTGVSPEGGYVYLSTNANSIGLSSYTGIKASIEVDIVDYSDSTVTKTGYWREAGVWNGNQLQWNEGVFHWNRTVPVTSLGIYAANGFATGGRIEVYGEGLK